MKWMLVLVLGCDWSLHRMQEQPRCETHGSTNLTPGGTCDLLPVQGTVALGDDEHPRPDRTRDLIVRGRDRFDRICAACHGLSGDGDSDVARAMTLRRPPSLLDAAREKLDDDRIFDAISSGYGVMPEYASVLPHRDRWAIVEYVRVLQAREVALDELAPDLRKEAMEAAR